MADSKENSGLEDVLKKELPDQKTIRLGEIGSPWLKTSGSVITEMANTKLRFPASLCTYDEMALDETVGAVLNLNNMFITNAFVQGEFEGNPDSEASMRYAEYLNWNIQNLDFQTWWDVVQNIIEYSKYGFSMIQKVYKKNTTSRFSEFPVKISKLQAISPYSIQQWAFTKDIREVSGFWQWPPKQAVSQTNSIPTMTTTNIGQQPIFFRRGKFMLFAWNSVNTNPQGKSPLASVYKVWQEKQWISDFEVVGVSRDLAGLAVLRMPTEIINKAAADPTSDEAATIKKLQTDAANLRSGDQSYVVLSSDTTGDNGNGKYEYDLTLQGIEGGSKNYTTSDLIDQRNKSIFDAFGASQLYLGSTTGGSYSLAESQNSLHAHFMQKHLLFIAKVLRSDLLPQLALLNNLTLTEDEMPNFVPHQIDEVDVGETASAMQKLGATNLIPRNKDFLVPIYEDIGWDTTSLSDMTEDEFADTLVSAADMQTGSGEGMESGMSNGTGSSNGSSGDQAVGNASQSTA